MTTYTLNSECNGIELYFTDKPAQQTIDALKVARWRWHRSKMCWYNKQSETALAMAQTIVDGNTPDVLQDTETAHTASQTTARVKLRTI